MSTPAADLIRRQRVLDAMAARGLDVLVLGRQDDADYASGMRRLWTAGTRPMGAGCVLVAATGKVHLLSSWDAGIPESVPFDDLVPMSWNPANLGASLAAIGGLAEARTVGVDAFSPSLERSLRRLAPDAELVAADDLMAAVRRIKDTGEIESIRAACAVAWLGVDAALAGGAGAALEAMARVGVTVPTTGVQVRADGAATVIDIGMVVDHYEGGVGGRFVDGERPGPGALVAACRAGATWDDLAAAAGAARWCVRGLGLGYEHPVLTAGLGRAERLEAGMVLSVAEDDQRDVVAVTTGAPDLLSGRAV